MRTAQSAIIVPVPEADALVGGCRTELDRSAIWGVPAHVTVLFPFIPPNHIDQRVLDALVEAVASVPCFEVTFARISWFGDQAVWLAPEPDEPFRALTEAVLARFPDYPPYGGAHAGIVPHLTIGHDAPVQVLQAAAERVRPGLPLRATVTAARLLCGTSQPASWRSVAELPLAA